MNRLLGTVAGVEIHEDSTKRVYYVAGMMIDADGANGQNGELAAYREDNMGSEHLGNGGMRLVEGKVIFGEDWGRDVVFVGLDGEPLVLPGGVIPSKTSYSYPDVPLSDPAAFVDAETVPYIAVPPLIVQKTVGAVLGCRCQCTNLTNGMTKIGIVADIGPKTKIGEASIAMARAVGIRSSPRSGGTDKHIIRYELWPGVSGFVNGMQVALRRMDGTYVT